MNLIKFINPWRIVEDYRKTRRRLEALENRVRELELANDPYSLWLFRNRTERMDATRRDIFNPQRADFHLERYRFASQFVGNCRVIDAACGTGYGSELLRTAGNALEAHGIDIDAEAIDYARAKHCSTGINFTACSATEIPLPSGWADVVTSFETIEHVPEDLPLLAEFARVLRPGGKLIISTPNNWPLELAPYHRRVYTRQSFEKVLRLNFSIDELYNQNSGTDSPFNHGCSAGMRPTTIQNESLAECYVAVCSRL